MLSSTLTQENKIMKNINQQQKIKASQNQWQVAALVQKTLKLYCATLANK